MNQKDNVLDKQGHQGDVFLQRIDAIPADATPIKPKNGRLILAEGEATGHNHSVDCQVASLFGVGPNMVLQVDETTTIDHQEHGSIEVQPGTYWVVPQMEYTPDEIKRVLD